jgi:hypothetical protein
MDGYNTINKIKYKNYLNKVGRFWISEVQSQSESSSVDLQSPEKQTTPTCRTGPTRQTGDFRIHKHEKMFAGGEGNNTV